VRRLALATSLLSDRRVRPDDHQIRASPEISGRPAHVPLPACVCIELAGIAAERILKRVGREKRFELQGAFGGRQLRLVTTRPITSVSKARITTKMLP